VCAKCQHHQVLFNLLSNAIKFSHDGGKVAISAESLDTNRVKLVVCDTGIGIKGEDVGQLFIPAQHAVMKGRDWAWR
jgi:signal transduction histidine kinase